jgi:hypothetical protein
MNGTLYERKPHRTTATSLPQRMPKCKRCWSIRKSSKFLWRNPWTRTRWIKSEPSSPALEFREINREVICCNSAARPSGGHLARYSATAGNQHMLNAVCRSFVSKNNSRIYLLLESVCSSPHYCGNLCECGLTDSL